MRVFPVTHELAAPGGSKSAIWLMRHIERELIDNQAWRDVTQTSREIQAVREEMEDPDLVDEGGTK